MRCKPPPSATGLVAATRPGRSAIHYGEGVRRRARAVHRRAAQTVPDPFPSAGELQKTYDTKLRHQREKYGAEESTVEAVMYALRQRGAAALRNERTRQRIVELSSRQLNGVIARLARLRGKYPKITDDLLLALAELLDG